VDEKKKQIRKGSRTRRQSAGLHHRARCASGVKGNRASTKVTTTGEIHQSNRRRKLWQMFGQGGRAEKTKSRGKAEREAGTQNQNSGKRSAAAPGNQERRRVPDGAEELKKKYEKTTSPPEKKNQVAQSRTDDTAECQKPGRMGEEEESKIPHGLTRGNKGKNRGHAKKRWGRVRQKKRSRTRSGYGGEKTASWPPQTGNFCCRR